MNIKQVSAKTSGGESKVARKSWVPWQPWETSVLFAPLQWNRPRVSAAMPAALLLPCAGIKNNINQRNITLKKYCLASTTPHAVKKLPAN
jgi:hypothetical protein